MSPLLLRFAILLLIFVAVILAIEGSVIWFRSSRFATRAINQRLELIARGQDRGAVTLKLRRNAGILRLPPPFQGLGIAFSRTVFAAGLAMSVGGVLRSMALGVALLFLVGLATTVAAGRIVSAGTFLILAAFSLALGFVLPMMYLSRRGDQRRKKVTEQFPGSLDIFVRGLKAGHPVASALELLTQETPDPLGSEFGLVVDEVTYGADLRDALQNMADRWDIADLHMFVVSLSVQAETGGNLAEILENLSKVIRERASMMMKVRALSSEGRMTALILTMLPVMAFVGLFLINPGFYLDVSRDPAFIIGFSVLIGLYVIGFVTIRRMINLKV